MRLLDVSMDTNAVASLSASLLLTRPNPPPLAMNARNNPKTFIQVYKVKGKAKSATNSVISFPNRQTKEEKGKRRGDAAWWTGLRQILSKTNTAAPKNDEASEESRPHMWPSRRKINVDCEENDTKQAVANVEPNEKKDKKPKKKEESGRQRHEWWEDDVESEEMKNEEEAENEEVEKEEKLEKEIEARKESTKINSGTEERHEWWKDDVESKEMENEKKSEKEEKEEEVQTEEEMEKEEKVEEREETCKPEACKESTKMIRKPDMKADKKSKNQKRQSNKQDALPAPAASPTPTALLPAAAEASGEGGNWWE